MSTHAVSKLDDLIVTAIDSIKGYEQAAGHAQAPRFADTLRAMAEDRRAVVATLQAESRRLGGTPNEFGSVAGDFHRRWEDFRHAFGGGDAAVAAEVDRGEAYLQEEFDRVLKDEKMPAQTMKIVRRVYASILQGREQAQQAKAVAKAA
jgi:uncharacterized protein (TIGR02284 family)